MGFGNSWFKKSAGYWLFKGASTQSSLWFILINGEKSAGSAGYFLC